MGSPCHADDSDGMKNLYDVLGVREDASDAEIKRAYRALVKKLHPDLHPGDARIEDRFKEVSAANAILGDPALRARYDRGEINEAGARPAPPPPPRPRSTAKNGHAHAQVRQAAKRPRKSRAEDILGDLLKGLRRPRAARPHRGLDEAYGVTVSFVEAAKGTTRQITLKSGKRVSVKIPAGVRSGQQIRLKQQGGAGRAGGPAGDAIIAVTVEPSHLFTRDGDDIHMDLPITLQEAVLGARITVPTIDGSVSVNVPAGSNTDRRLRLAGKGLVRSKGGGRGDQYIRLKVVLPNRPDDDLRDFVERWAPDHPYDVRKVWHDT